MKFGISFTLIHLNQAGALVHVYTDGSIHLNHGGTEMGQGLFTKVAQVVAEEFGVPIDFVRITATNTAKVPNASPTAASSGSDINGMAAQIGAREIKQRMVEFACGAMGRRRRGDRLSRRARADRQQVDVVRRTRQDLPVEPRAALRRRLLQDACHHLGPRRPRPASRSSISPSAPPAREVAIDTLTGEMKVERVDILHDVGSSLNPALDIGQVEGGFVQGMGWLTTEELVFDAEGPARRPMRRRPTRSRSPPTFPPISAPGCTCSRTRSPLSIARRRSASRR